MDWDKLLSCVGEQQDQSAQKILLSIPLKWFNKGLVTLALDFIAGLSLPNNTASRYGKLDEKSLNTNQSTVTVQHVPYMSPKLVSCPLLNYLR